MSRPAPSQAPPLSLYLHFPWCESLCPYCDFNSHLPAAKDLGEEGGEEGLGDGAAGAGDSGKGLAPRLAESWAQGVLRDLDEDLPLLRQVGQPRQIQSLFLGGGTPSLLPPEALAGLLADLRGRLDFAADAEITMEANPSSSEAARFSGYRKAGVNRLSIGVQSFHDATLRGLGRVHDGEAARRAVRAARQAGFAKLNLDLIWGAPGQTPELALADLREALALDGGRGPGHVSWYELNLEPGTRFYSAPPSLPDEAALEAIWEQGAGLLRSAGYEAYEISAWHRPGAASAHNCNYWSFGDYLGLGPGAHTKLSFPGEGVLRWQRQRRPQTWLRDQGLQGRVLRRWLDAADLRLEFVLNAMRLSRGVPESLFAERTGLDLEALAPGRARAERLGLLRPGALAPTALGMRMHNDLVGLFH